jgi:hypothetical protein
VATHLGRVGTGARVMLVALCVPFALLVVLCLASAVRPGSLGRAARRARSRRRGGCYRTQRERARPERPPWS